VNGRRVRCRVNMELQVPVSPRPAVRGQVATGSDGVLEEVVQRARQQRGRSMNGSASPGWRGRGIGGFRGGGDKGEG
jgi:hypothetical protein